MIYIVHVLHAESADVVATFTVQTGHDEEVPAKHQGDYHRDDWFVDPDWADAGPAPFAAQMIVSDIAREIKYDLEDREANHISTGS